MKIAICKIGANITFNSNNASAAMADIVYALRTLGVENHDISIVTKRTRNTFIPKVLKFQELMTTDTFDDFDIVLLFNGRINFYGGNESPDLLQLYRTMSNTTLAPIAYVQTDGAIWFEKLWPVMTRTYRPWLEGVAPEQFDIDSFNVHYITQGRDLDRVASEIRRKDSRIRANHIHHYPWERTILAQHEKFFSAEPKGFANRHYDLVYGGATRNSYKRKKIEKFYNSSRLSTLLFGNLKGTVCPNAIMSSKVPYQSMISMMQRGKATVIIGDKFYNDNFFTLRMYEAILAGNAILIDREFDTKHRFYAGLSDMMYVRSNKEVETILENGNLERVAQKIRNLVFAAYELSYERLALEEILEDIIE